MFYVLQCLHRSGEPSPKIADIVIDTDDIHGSRQQMRQNAQEQQRPGCKIYSACRVGGIGRHMTVTHRLAMTEEVAWKGAGLAIVYGEDIDFGNVSTTIYTFAHCSHMDLN